MKVHRLRIPGLAVIEPAVHGDARGAFYEEWNRARYAEHGLDFNVVQANVSRSVRGVLRGLHYQWPNPQGKLVSVTEGEVWDVAVDIRRGSPSFGQWEACVLSAENHRTALRRRFQLRDRCNVTSPGSSGSPATPAGGDAAAGASVCCGRNRW